MFVGANVKCMWIARESEMLSIGMDFADLANLAADRKILYVNGYVKRERED